MRLKITTVTLLLLLATPLFAQSLEGVAVSRADKLRAAGLLDYARFETGRNFFEAGDYRSAAAELKTFASEFPDSLLLDRAELTLGKSYFNLKNYPLAIQTFGALVDRAPDAGAAPEASYLVARADEQLKKWPAAYLAYQSTDLNYPLSYFGRQARLAIAQLKKAHRRKLPKFQASAKALYKQGMSYFDDNDYETAANIFYRLAREYPKSKYVGEALLMLGRAESQTDNPAAIADLEKASEGPANLAGQATYYLGLAYGRRGRYDRAIAAMEKIPARYPDSDLCASALYWAAYYKEQSDDLDGALRSYYDIINKYPESQSVASAIWRLGRAYYWHGDFKNAATYLDLARQYSAGEDSPRCYFFAAKAQERLGNRSAALDLYEKLVRRFDHTYYAYRAKEKLKAAGRLAEEPLAFDKEDFSRALSNLDGQDQEGLAAVMEIWEQTSANEAELASSQEVQSHLSRYKELMSLGITDYAADEAKYLVNLTSDAEKDSAQIKLGEMLFRSGEYKTPLKFADRKVKAAIVAGKPTAVPKKVWQLAYPKGYWNNVAAQAGAYGVDPYLVLAVIREESRFNPRAVSHSGARGLMQIMPRTGRVLAHNLGKSDYRTRKLFTPALNIEMGSCYLSDLVKSFQGNVYLSLAGYNGGPNKIRKYLKSWYNDNLNSVDIDEFVETIPGRETRLYVQKVMGSYFEYKRLYGGKNG